MTTCAGNVPPGIHGANRSYDNWAGVEQTAQNVNGWLALSSISLANLNQPGTVTTPGTSP